MTPISENAILSPYVYFVYGKRDLLNRLRALDPVCLPAELKPPLPFEDGPACWIMQTYLHLRWRGYPVHLSDRIVPDAINVLHFDDLGLRHFPSRGFLVVVRADRAVPAPADLTIVQNKCLVFDTSRDHYVLHWPQPGLVPRDKSRGSQLQTLAYFGIPAYARSAFYGNELSQRLKKIGVTLSLRFTPESWTDYRDVDAVLAVRSASEYDKNLKPPSKLLNAWRAGCVGMMGVESAYHQVGRPGHDYLEIKEPRDVVDWCRRLNSEPGAFARLIQNGATAAEGYTDDAIAARWTDLLFGLAQERYTHWMSRPLLLRRGKAAAAFPLVVLRNKLEKQKFRQGIKT